MTAETQIIISAKDLASDVFHKVGLSAEGLKRIVEKTEGLVPFAGFGLGAYLAKDALKSLLEATVKHMDKMGKLAQQVGMTTEEVTGFSFAAQLADVSTEEFVRSVEKLSKNMVGAVGGVSEGMDSMAAGGNKVRAALVALGFSQKQIVEGQRDMPAFLGQIADKFHGAEDGATKTAIAMMLFGKSGAAMIPLLNQGGAAIAGMRREAEELGLVFGDDLAKRAEEVNDNFKRLHARFDGAKNAATQGLIPALRDVSEAFLTGRANLEAFSKAGEGLAFVFRTIASGASSVWSALKLLGAMTEPYDEAEFMYHDYHPKSRSARDPESYFSEPGYWVENTERKNAADKIAQDYLDAQKKIWGIGSETNASGLETAGAKTRLKNPDTDSGKGLDTIKTLRDEAMKADQALLQVHDTISELMLTMDGDTYGAALLRNQRETNKDLMDAVREYAKIDAERKSLAAKGKLTGEAARLLDERAAATAGRMEELRTLGVLKDQQEAVKAELEKSAHDAEHMTAMAGYTGQSDWKARANAIKAKYDALRKDPKSRQYASDWDAEENAALARLEQDKAKSMAQQRAELAQLVGDTHAYYGEQVKILTIERDLAGTTEERRLKQEQLNRAQAQFEGNGMDGLRRAMRDYSGDASDMWKNFYTAGKGAVGKVEDALVDLSSGKGIQWDTFGQQMAGEINRALFIRPMLSKITGVLADVLGVSTETAQEAAMAAAAAGLQTAGVGLDASAIALNAAALELSLAAQSLSSGGIGSSFSDAANFDVSSVFDPDNFFNLSGSYADGGQTGSGLILVGEGGPELLNMRQPGYVYNNAQTQDLLSGAGGGSTNHVTIHQSFDFRGADSGTETRLRAYAGVIKKQATQAAVAEVKALANRGGSYSKSLGRRAR